jgi:hypothetical protein
VRVDNPTQNLESYFLDVVNKARAANETSGAQSGARVAEYLRGGVGDKPATDKVLEKLSLPPATQPPVEAKSAAQPAASRVGDKKLEALAQASQPAPPPAKPASAPETKPVDLSKANERLSSLLGGKK